MLSPPDTRWIVKDADEAAVSALARELGVSEVSARVLATRGIADPDEAHAFLTRDLGDLDDGSGLLDVETAAERIARAVRDEETILVVGDYDVDGLCGGAVLHRFLEVAGADVDLRIPHRIDEGYGLRPAHVREAAEAGASLIVTADNGIRALEAADEAGERGVDLVVTDHHTAGEALPEAVAVVRPGEEDTPYRDLCGTGVAFKTVWATARALSGTGPGGRVSPAFRTFLRDALSYVALATVADCVPLAGENRALVSFGQRHLGRTEHPGLRALLREARVDGSPSAEDIAFRIAPRLNAAGRMDDAELGARLLLSTDEDEAAELADRLGKLNRRRQRVQRTILERARDLAEEDPGPGYVLADDDWHAGVIGIVAGRLAEDLRRPVILIASNGSRSRGSGRSVEGVSLVEALDRCGDCLVGHGGHDRAAGLTIETDRIPELRDRFRETVEEHLPEGGPPEPPLAIDATVSLDRVGRPLVDELDELGPFGEAYDPPVLGTRDLRLVGRPRTFGRGDRHVEFHVRPRANGRGNGNGSPGDGAVRRVVAFGGAGRVGELDRVANGLEDLGLALVFRPALDTYKARTRGPSIVLKALDWKVHST